MRERVTQADIDAAKLYLQGTGPWKLDEIGIGVDDYLVKCFARHRLAIIEECAKVAQSIISADQYDTMDTGCYQDTANRIAEAIRALAD